MTTEKGKNLSRRSVLVAAAAASLSTVAGLPRIGNAADAPQKGGLFRYAVVGAGASDTLEPATYADIAPAIMGWQSRNNLVELTAENGIAPELSESFEATDGGKTWIFKLRKDVEFHNGKTLDSHDVVFSLSRHIGDDSKSAVKPLFEPVTDLKADGKNTVIVKLDSANADFPYYLGDYHVQIVQDGTTDFNDGMGTGPYIMKSFEPGVRCSGVRNPNYWKDGHGNFDEVECLAIGDSTARVQALQTGELHAIMFVDLKVADRLDAMPGLKVIEVQSGTHMTLPMNVNAPPFDNRDVRLALKFSVDRDQLIKTILRGHGTVANDHPIAPSSPYYNDDLPQRAFDPDKARHHLKKAGLETLQIPLSSSAAILGYGNDVAALYKESAAKAGIGVQIVREPADGYWSNVWQKKPWCQSYFAARPTPDAIFSLAYKGGAAWNETFWADERFDQLLIQARAELDETLRKEMYGEMQQILSDEGGSVIPFFASTMDAAVANIRTRKVAGGTNLDGGRAADRWWFSS